MYEDVKYRSVAGEELLARRYKPGGSADVLVVEVHGGAWTMNDRTTNSAIHEHLAQNGIAVLALDFRLAPKHRYPAAIEDVNYGIRWAKANLRPRKIGGLGTSSGGHQIVLAALQPEKFAGNELKGYDGRLDFVVALWPILDPFARYQYAKGASLKNLVDAHDAFWPGEAAMKEGNPQLVVERNEATAKPPILAIQGTNDTNVEHFRADRFADAYRARGGSIELVKVEGQPHAFIAKDPAAPAARDALARVAAFIQSQSRKERAHG
jgi:acetyl esterase/lipase